MRGVRGPKSTVPSSAILVGSVAAEQLYRALGTLTPGFPIPGGGGGGGGGMGGGVGGGGGRGLRDQGLMLALYPFFL